MRIWRDGRRLYIKYCTDQLVSTLTIGRLCARNYMAIKLGRLRRIRRRNIAVTTSQSASVSVIDKTLSRVANASQLGLLLLAAFGYFYTVIPVYQKSLLDEEIAKKTLELNAKDSELRVKAAELAELNASVSTAREVARRSQAEVGKLKGTVREQYGELQPRLIQDFQVLGSKLCKLGSIPDGGLAACIREKVLTTVNLSGLTEGDRRLLQSLVERDNDDIHKSWHEFLNTLQERRNQAEARKKEFDGRCEQMRASKDYKDKIKKISIDYQCSSDAIDSRSDFLKIDIDSHYKGEEFLASHLSYIAKDFFAKVPAP